MNRRKIINQSLAGAVMVNTMLAFSLPFLKSDFPVIQLISGDKQHWFGYYDKWQVDPGG